MQGVKRPAWVLFLLVVFCSTLHAQPTTDTLKMTLEQADQAFLQKSFSLLAAHYEIDMANARVIQARLWPNPTLSIDQGAYDQVQKKWFDVSRNGETAVSLDQLIHLAGQRSKLVDLEKVNAAMANDQFADVAVNLKYDLHTSFYDLYFQRQSIAVYSTEIESLNTLVVAFTQQAQLGNVSKLELVRLQALQFGLQKDRNDLLSQAAEEESQLRVLVGDTTTRAIEPVLNPTTFDQYSADQLVYSELLDSAYQNRNDLKMAEAQIDAGKADLRLQKSLRVPDLILGANYDRQGSYVRNYNSLSLAFDIPIFDRNQGNIKLSNYHLEQSTLERNQVEAIVSGDVTKAYTAFQDADHLYKSSVQSFNEDYGALLHGITESYRNHTISLLQFVDYYESYKDSRIAFNELQTRRLESMEALNLATDTEVFK